MPARINPSKGNKPDKLMRDALIIALNREAQSADGKPTKKLSMVAEALVNKAVDGDVPAIREILDRVDGRVPQETKNEHSGPNGEPLLSGIKVTFVKGTDNSG